MRLAAKNEYILLEQYNAGTGDFEVPAGTVSELRYKVISTGENVTSCKVDDLVICYAEPPIKIAEHDYWVTKDEAIIAVVEQ